MVVTPVRLIALFVSLAIVLAGPASSWAASGDCCCTDAAAQVEAEPTDSCCQSDGPVDQDSHDTDLPGECPSDCESCVSCSVMGQPVQMSRPASPLDLPDPQPDAFTALEPESHAIEPHFSLLRPPQR